MRKYEKPAVENYGSIEAITQQNDKIGSYDDHWTRTTNIPVDGSIVPDSS